MSSQSEGGSASGVDSCGQGSSGSSGFSALSLEDLTSKSYFLRRVWEFSEAVDRRSLVQTSQEIRWDCADFAVPDLV